MRSFTFLLFFLLAVMTGGAVNVLDLSGNWLARLQGDDRLHTVSLPGSLLTNNLGDDLSVNTRWTGTLYDSSFYYNPYMAPYRRKGHMKFPFFLTPNKHYVGEVVYTRSIVVPKAWKGRKVTIFLERPHIETTVWVNGKEVGHQMSLNTPHVYDVSAVVEPGKKNTIAITVYNGIENVGVGQDSHSVTDQTQGNWNGLAGRMELQCHGRHPVGHVQVFPQVKEETATVVVSGTKDRVTLLLDGHVVNAKRLDDSTYLLPMKNARQWSETSPYVYHLAVCSRDDTCRTVFGMRAITIRGRQFYLNGHPIWIRGTVENCTFPLTGFPPTDVASWRRIFVKCKQYGLNAMRFHSYCPPEAAFAAADEVGFYLAPEGPSWPNHGVKMNYGMPIDSYLMAETQRMVRHYGNHPSFLMMSAGNEPAGDWVSWGNRWVAYWKKSDPRRVYCSFNVGGGWAWDNGSEYHVKGGGRGLDWNRAAPQSVDNFEQDLSFPRNYKDSIPNHSPIIAHEQGQWCAFPDLRERSQYTGVYKAYNFDIFEDLLRDNGMAAMAGKFLYASGKLQTLCYRFEMERNLRTRGYAGFMLLGLNDYSGQGTALVGPLNVFWREKGYVDSTQWRQSCNDLVVMAEFPKFVFASGESCKVSVDVYNAVYGKELLRGARLSYAITPSVSDTVVCTLDLPCGKNLHVARIPLDTRTDRPGKYTLTLRLQTGSRTVTNQYDYWVYPPLPSQDCEPHDRNLYIADSLDAQALAVLRRGGKVLITAAGKVRYGNDVRQTYMPVFWNTSWFKMRPPHTTGLTIDTQHPLFREFPTDDWANLNWWELVNKAQVMNLSELPKDYQSPIQPIDTWHVSRKLGMLIEARVLKGKLLMTTMDISTCLDRRLVVRQMRKAILDYMESDRFQPALTLPVSVITDFFSKTAPAVNMFTNESPDELKPRVK